MAARSPSIATRRGVDACVAGYLHPPACQRGISLLLFTFLVLVVGSTLFLTAWNSGRFDQAQEQRTELALREAKEALVGKAASPSISSAGYLPLPDLGFLIGAPKEGYEAGSFPGNNQDYSVIGKLPWKSLRTPPLRDGQGECLWYVVSGRFKDTPKTAAFNWDTLGQIDIIDGNGADIATNLAALIVAPGVPLDGQDRTLADASYTECGGNYVASNYLDAHGVSNAISGQVNYFVGSTNNRVALNADKKQFVRANTAHYNDRFLAITVDDIFRPIIRRSDFAAQIGDFLDDPQFQSQVRSMVISGTKGTDSLNCNNTGRPEFCANWKEMLFVTQLSAPSSIVIDGLSWPACDRVVIFAGQKTAGQNRVTEAAKANKSNYLEEPNLGAFATPVAASSDFIGTLTFKPEQASADIVRCIPLAPSP